MEGTASCTPRTELAARESNGVSVRLLWSRTTNEVAVRVDDRKLSEIFELSVPEGRSALDVFYHPYAYARANTHEAA